MPVQNPAWLSGGVDAMSNLTLPYNRLAIIAFARLVLRGVSALIACTRLGLFVRGVTQNRKIAACMDVSTAHVDTYAFALGSGIAGLAGGAVGAVRQCRARSGRATSLTRSWSSCSAASVSSPAPHAAMGLGVPNKLLEGWQGAVLA